MHRFVPRIAKTRASYSTKDRNTNLSAVVQSFWEGIMKTTKNKQNQHIPNPVSERLISHLSTPVPSFPKTDPKKILEKAVRARREMGDMIPGLMARQVREFYEGLNFEEKKIFLRVLAHDFGVKAEDVLIETQEFQSIYEKTLSNELTPRALLRGEEKLRQALQPQYDNLFHQIQTLPGGKNFIVNMRADLLKMIEGKKATSNAMNNPFIRSMDLHMKTLLQRWFGMTLMELQKIDWDTPASILEKIQIYEAVHEIRSWQELKQRLGPGRLCYAFFHPAIPGEPLTFVQIALTSRIPDNVQAIISEQVPPNTHPKSFNTAVFYSISSSQKGLSGVDLGNFLIKRVVRELHSTLPNLNTFVTLSPLPKFRAWVYSRIENELSECGERILLDEEVEKLRGIYKGGEEYKVVLGKFYETLQSEDSFLKDPLLEEVFKPILQRLCIRYLFLEKKRGLALDPVANFHIRNGACFHRVHWRANNSRKGISQSFGMMVNYSYLSDYTVEKNNQAYLLDGTMAVTADPMDPSLQLVVDKVGVCEGDVVVVGAQNNHLIKLKKVFGGTGSMAGAAKL